MFYQLEMEENLRFGDVVKGFVFAAPQVNEPILSLDDEPNYSIDVTIPRFSVVLTPCCSIEKKTILLSPLVPVLINFFDNPHYSENLTRINQPVPPDLAFTPDSWEHIPEEEKQRFIAIGPEYQLRQFFVYAPYSGLLPEYTLSRRDKNSETGQRRINTSHYMVDFGSIHRVDCDKINRQGEGSPAPPNVKHMQLSVYARKELRDKFLAYYARVTNEDEVLLKG